MIPLLFETGNHYPLDAIIVVDTPIEKQVERLMQRDEISEEDVLKIIDSQIDRETRLKGADFVIENNGDISDLSTQVLKLNQHFIS